jgi:hypothetical protein
MHQRHPQKREVGGEQKRRKCDTNFVEFKKSSGAGARKSMPVQIVRVRVARFNSYVAMVVGSFDVVASLVRP